ncbi:hypothetical protein [Aureimonas sp. AU40]|uniref:hypothetical protein n=1 Tax=Aureimonas sp. AU40 TaxID=1637747 RepID=UPI000784BEBE|nr:hypothetical protein [Aureimonas sp. AU40]
MRVHLASITHRHGTSQYAGSSREELIEKLGVYCRENDENKLLDHAVSDEEIVSRYFSEENYGSNEYVDFADDEEITVDVSTMVRMFAALGNPGMAEGSVDLHDAIAKATLLSEPMIDYEGAARAQGWQLLDIAGGGQTFLRESQVGGDTQMDRCAPDWSSLCGNHDIGTDDFEQQPTGFFAISQGLADCLPLEERVVRDLAGMIIWARAGETVRGLAR